MSEQRTPAQSNPLSIFWLALIITPLLVRVPALFITHNWWGLNHSSFYPWWVSAVIIAAGALWALRWMTLPQDSNNRNSPLGKFWDAVENRRGALSSSALSLIVFWGLSGDMFLYGDGYVTLGNLAQQAHPQASPFAFLAGKLDVFLFNFLPGLSSRPLNQAGAILRIEAALSGALAIWLWLKTAVALTSDITKRTFLFGLVAGSGVTTLFFGIGYHYAVATAIISLFIYIYVKLIKSQERRRRIQLGAGLIMVGALAPLYLGQLVFLWPGLVFMVGLAFFPGAKSERAWGVAALLSLAALVYLTYARAGNDLWVAARLTPLLSKPPEFEYGLLRYDRLIDLLNSKLVLIPLYPFFLYVILTRIWRERCDHFVGGLGVLSLSTATWLFISDSPGGSPREIVTVAPAVVAPLLLCGYLWIKKQNSNAKTTRLAIVSAVTSLALMAPVYLYGEPAVQYLDHDYQTRTGRYRSGLLNFRDHYFYKKEFSTADKREWSLRSKAEEYLDMETVRGMVGHGRFTEALDRLPFILNSHPYWSEPYTIHALALRGLGREQAALVEIDKALQLAPDNPEKLTVRGDILRALKQWDESEKAYLSALALEPDSREALSRLGMMYYESGRFSDADKIAFLIFETYPNNGYSYLIRGLTSFERKDYARAMRCFKKIEQSADQIPEWPVISEIMTEIRQARPELR